MQRDRHAVARLWLANAERDLRVARVIVRDEPAIAAFHAQQAAEKALKAAAIAASDDHARTHAIGVLLAELRDLDVTVPLEIADGARALDPYYLSTRYVDVVSDVDPGESVPSDDAERAIERAAAVHAFAADFVERGSAIP